MEKDFMFEQINELFFDNLCTIFRRHLTLLLVEDVMCCFDVTAKFWWKLFFMGILWYCFSGACPRKESEQMCCLYCPYYFLTKKGRWRWDILVGIISFNICNCKVCFRWKKQCTHTHTGRYKQENKQKCVSGCMQTYL